MLTAPSMVCKAVLLGDQIPLDASTAGGGGSLPPGRGRVGSGGRLGGGHLRPARGSVDFAATPLLASPLLQPPPAQGGGTHGSPSFQIERCRGRSSARA